MCSDHCVVYDYEQEAAALYALPPAQFTTARDVRIAELRGAKQAMLAGRLKLLRRPTVAAWCVNLLAAEYRDDLSALVGLGERLADAQRHGDAGAIRGLSDEKRQRVAALVGAAARLAVQSLPPRGEPVGLEPSVVADLEATLNAAVADVAVGRRVLSGRLTRGESYAGFGPLPEDASPSSSTGTQLSTGPARAAYAVAVEAVTVARTERDGARRRRDVARHAREEAAAVLAEAEQRLADAERTLAGAERTVERAEQHRRDSAADLDAATAADEPSGRRTSRSAARST